MKSTFDDIDEAAAKATETTTAVAEATAPAASTSTEVATQETGVSTNVRGSEDRGLDPEDINIDHIQILGKSSHFDIDGASIGDICFNKEVALSPVNEPVRCILVHERKYWKENVPYEDDTVPRFANTVEERIAIEADSAFGDTVPVCDITILLERPLSFEDDEAASGIFIYEFGGKEYALVKYTVQKSQAVRENYGTINTRVRALATKGTDAKELYFDLRSKEKGGGSKFKWHQFVLSGGSQEAPAEAVAFARSLRGE